MRLASLASSGHVLADISHPGRYLSSPVVSEPKSRKDERMAEANDNPRGGRKAAALRAIQGWGGLDNAQAAKALGYSARSYQRRRSGEDAPTDDELRILRNVTEAPIWFLGLAKDDDDDDALTDILNRLRRVEVLSYAAVKPPEGGLRRADRDAAVRQLESLLHIRVDEELPQTQSAQGDP